MLIQFYNDLLWENGMTEWNTLDFIKRVRVTIDQHNINLSYQVISEIISSKY